MLNIETGIASSVRTKTQVSFVSETIIVMAFILRHCALPLNCMCRLQCLVRHYTVQSAITVFSPPLHCSVRHYRVQSSSSSRYRVWLTSVHLCYTCIIKQNKPKSMHHRSRLPIMLRSLYNL